MSGICGLLRLDGAPAEGVGAMAELLERRGPEGAHLWEDGSVALGHTLLATTPEALHEMLPLTDAATGCTITADVRLDNRDELLTALGLQAAGRIVGDGELLLRAWMAWGEECLDRLLGDFAFAIWDPRSQRLFAARDHMGMKPFAYAFLPGHLIAFASEPRAVLEARGVPRDLDEGRIADFFEDYLETLDATSTFFRSVRRLPPAHALLAGPAGLTIRRYWSLETGPELNLGSDDAYAEALREVFTEAVRSRLRSAGRVGSMLSGGMDSGSIVAVASRLLAAEGRGPLPTFSAIGPDPETCVETRAIRASLTMTDLEPHLADWSDPDPWREDLVEPLRAMGEPFDGHMNLPRVAYLMAKRAGVKVVLDGVSGDVVLHRGNVSSWLLRRGRWPSAWREAKGLTGFYGLNSTRWLIQSGVSGAFVPPPLNRLRWLRRLRKGDRHGWVGSFPGLADRARLAERRLAFARSHIAWRRSHVAEQVDTITSTTALVARERYDRVAASFGIEPRDPYLDLRVVRFASRLPLEQLQSGGWPKVILRRAMEGFLPDEVRWRKGKEGVGWRFTEALLASASLAAESDLITMPEERSALLAAGVGTEDELYFRLWLQGQHLGLDVNSLYAAWRQGA